MKKLFTTALVALFSMFGISSCAAKTNCFVMLQS